MDISRLTIDRENWKIKRGMYKRNRQDHYYEIMIRQGAV